ncbi:substrate-binding domain-containing protein [Pantoea sp.]|uniref:substrate-binding domain-containing protein n=1 Tax=Pantoea sp. TaxID=69393 RepID=UPI00290BF8A5|nr:substrate-binding domain-containing protein [Pantoea sp.]MDU4125944.1 substrate-binding domain-containing protein [Pantoea sp.]
MTLSTDQQPDTAFPPMIGVISSPLLNCWQQKILHQLTHQLNARGVLMLLMNAATEQALAAQLTQAAPLGLRGLLLLPGAFSDSPPASILTTASLPVLQLDAEQVMQTDARLAGEAIGRLLLADGHQRLGYLQSQAGSSPQKQGYSASLMAADQAICVDLVAGGNDREQGWQAMTDYLKQTRAAERIQALFCESDLLAFGAMQAIRDFGQGAHVAVVGFGDLDEAQSSTWHLTSWSVNIERAINDALNRLLGPCAAQGETGGEGGLKRRHSHLGKQRPGEMSECGCAHRH